MEKWVDFIIFLLYVGLGFYLLNLGYKFIEIPEIVSNYDYIIFFIAGLFLIFGGVNYYRVKGRKDRSRKSLMRDFD